MTRRRLLAGGAGGTLALLAGCTGMTPFVGQRLTDQYAFSPENGSILRVIGDVGEINIHGEDRDDIDIDAVKQSSSVRTDIEDLSVDIEESDGTVEVRTEWDGDVGLFESHPSIDLDIAIPARLAVERVETSTGRIDIQNVRGDLVVETSTGRITVNDIDGSLDAHARTGRIAATGVSGLVSARTTTGRIELRDIGRLGAVDSTTGRIEVDVPAIDGDTRVSATTGRISAAIDPDIDVDIRASTSTGRISVEGLDLDREASQSDFVLGSLGDGGPELELQTNTGGITISAR